MSPSSSATTATKSLVAEKWLIACVVTFYMTSALTMVFVNKAVLNSSPTLPVTFLIVQLTMAVILLHVSTLFSPKVAKDVPKWNEVVPHAKQKWRSLWKVVSVNAIGLLFNTLCLRDVDATFFQIARGLVLPLTIITSAICIRARPSLRVILAATGVTTGFLIGVAPSISPFAFRDIPLQTLTSDFKTRLAASPLSLFYGFLSSLFIALHAVWIKSSLPALDNSAIALAWWSNFIGIFILAPIALLNGEVPVLISLLYDFSSDASRTFLIGSLVTGVVGFFLCISSLISIKVTSPITHMFSSAARSVIQTLIGVSIFGDLLTVNRALSILVILIGTMFYTWVKSVEAATQAKPNAGAAQTPKELERGLLRQSNDSDSDSEGLPLTPMTPRSETMEHAKRDMVTIWEAEDEKDDHPVVPKERK